MRAHRFTQSSTIERISFEDDAGILFRATGRYRYYEVPAAIFDAFCKAPSAGAFFNEAIKDRFRFRRDPERRRFGLNA